jgi:hypothetical protein
MEQYPDRNKMVQTGQYTVALDANVQRVVNAINTNQVVPYGDYGGPNVYYFQTMENGLGNLIYTIFDKATNLGLASYSVRYGAATNIREAILLPYPRAQIDLQFLVLPKLNICSQPSNGTVTP